MKGKLEAMELRFCGTVVVVLAVLVCVCLFVITWPILLSLCLPFDPATCQVYSSAVVIGATNCSSMWTSCQDSCTNPRPNCTQVLVQYWHSNVSAVVPLFANILGCGYSLHLSCPEFLESFTDVGRRFDCNVYHDPDFAVPDGHDSQIELVRYVAVSLIPSAVLIACLIYMWRRKLLAKGYKKAKKMVKKKTNEPRSFYQKKMMELEFKKSLRQLKMKNTENDVKVFNVNNSQTTGALILKPRFSLAYSVPPKIIV